jgi:ABC-type transporter Mla maintaining outer membrane lipid asymmetry permease subunit MlaE
MVKVALFGIVVAVIAVWMRFSRGQSRDGVGYEKTRA